MLKQYAETATAVGSTCTLVIVSNLTDEEAHDFLRQLWHHVFSFERRFSRFLPGSELSRFNRSAGTKQFISPQFKELLTAARELSSETGGLYNPFIAPALQRAGYTKSMVSGHENDEHDDYSARAVVPSDQLQIAEDTALIPYNTALDLGGCGKGYLADQLATMARQQVAGFWFSLGGDIVAGGTDTRGEQWDIGIERAGDESARAGHVKPPGTEPFAVATSGVFARQGVHNGQRWHHLIDSRTLQPAVTDIASATVCDYSALRADVFASCAVILGSGSAPAFLRQRTVEAALLQLIDDRNGDGQDSGSVRAGSIFTVDEKDIITI